MMKKVLAAILALSVFSVSASTLPTELENLENLEQKLVDRGVDVESFKESALELNLDPTLTDAEVAETVVDFTRSQLETGSAYKSAWASGAWVVFAASVFAALYRANQAKDKVLEPGEDEYDLTRDGSFGFAVLAMAVIVSCNVLNAEFDETKDGDYYCE